MSNNPVYTYHEKQHFNLGANSRKRKIGIESIRRFDHCALCLSLARDAQITHRGIIYCKECIFADLLSQKQEIKKTKQLLKQLKQKRKEMDEGAKAVQRDEAVEAFDRAQRVGGGLSAGLKKVEKTASDTQNNTKETPKLPAFWLSSLQPNLTDKEALTDRIREMESTPLITMCRQASPTHPLALKDLHSVNLKYADADTVLCSGCDKTLSNSSTMFVTKSCSSLLCKYCIDTLYLPSLQCPKCDSKVDKEEDLIKVSVEGTGFAGGGGVMLKKRTGTIGLN
ncbi:hypothetical protein E3P99_01115 [Wallemia hederae]|uniref:RING-type domain-containing protein n=1 Tax=Wallemia hederae TaxID=1540922 RepID=A0A4T0FSA6_9BASI|nr:hypothetical protein E3P99_01115 [Wallemia hederae]